eukprot:m51a1_g2165 hypothetical protein (502) ;mRNA; f:50339-51844
MCSSALFCHPAGSVPRTCASRDLKPVSLVDALPSFALLDVFALLPTRDQASLALCCRSLYELSFEPPVHRRVLVHCAGNESRVIRSVCWKSWAPHVRSLVLLGPDAELAHTSKGDEISARTVQILLRYAPGLEEFVARSVTLMSDAVLFLPRFPRLARVDVGCNDKLSCDRDYLFRIGLCVSAMAPRLKAARFGALWQAVVAGLTGAHRTSGGVLPEFEEIGPITSAGLSLLLGSGVKMPKLRELSLTSEKMQTWANVIEDDVLKRLGRARPSIEPLFRCNGMAAIPAIPTLRRLSLDSPLCKQLALVIVGRQLGLTEVVLKATPNQLLGEKEVVVFVQSCPKLRTLIVRGELLWIDPRLSGAISHLPSLEFLSVTGEATWYRMSSIREPGQAVKRAISIGLNPIVAGCEVCWDGVLRMLGHPLVRSGTAEVEVDISCLDKLPDPAMFAAVPRLCHGSIVVHWEDNPRLCKRALSRWRAELQSMGWIAIAAPAIGVVKVFG